MTYVVQGQSSGGGKGEPADVATARPTSPLNSKSGKLAALLRTGRSRLTAERTPARYRGAAPLWASPGAAKVVSLEDIECVLGLGPNLFYNSPMEACVVVCGHATRAPTGGPIRQARQPAYTGWPPHYVLLPAGPQSAKCRGVWGLAPQSHPHKTAGSRIITFVRARRAR